MVQTGDGIAIVDNGLSLGGGYLQQFGINSNTSANGFIKCLYKKKVSNTPNLKNLIGHRSAAIGAKQGREGGLDHPAEDPERQEERGLGRGQ